MPPVTNGDFNSYIEKDIVHLRRVAMHLVRYTRICEADDLLNDSVVRATGGLGTYRGEPGKLRSWMCVIINNTYRDLFKSQRRKPYTSRIDGMDFASGEMMQSEAVCRAEIRDALRGAIGELSQKLGEVLTMYFFDDLSYKEIATNLRIPEGTVKSRMSRGLQRLREGAGDKYAI